MFVQRDASAILARFFFQAYTCQIFILEESSDTEQSFSSECEIPFLIFKKKEHVKQINIVERVS